MIALRVTGNSSLTTRRSIHSAIHEQVVGGGGECCISECRFSASSQLAASHVTRNGKIDPGDNDPPPKMTQGVMTPPNPPSSPSTASLSGVARCWHSNTYFSLFSSLFFFDPPNRLIVDEDGVYEPRSPNDRLLLGMKGTMSEMELSIFRQHSIEAINQKARRGELIRTVAVGYLKTDDDRIEKDADRRVQDAIALVFHKFEELQSVRQVLVWMRREQMLAPM